MFKIILVIFENSKNTLLVNNILISLLFTGDKKVAELNNNTHAIVDRKELNPNFIDPIYLAAVESVEEAVINAIVAGEDVPTFKPPGMVCKAIDLGVLKSMFSQY